MTTQVSTPATPATPTLARLRCGPLGFETWRREIAPLWHMEGAADMIAAVTGESTCSRTCASAISRVRPASSRSSTIAMSRCRRSTASRMRRTAGDAS
jgi:hypothetical protein